MRSPLLPTRRDLANTALSAAIGVVAGAIIAVEQRRRPTTTNGRTDVGIPDDPAWHAAIAARRVTPSGYSTSPR